MCILNFWRCCRIYGISHVQLSCCMLRMISMWFLSSLELHEWFYTIRADVIVILDIVRTTSGEACKWQWCVMTTETQMFISYPSKNTARRYCNHRVSHSTFCIFHCLVILKRMLKIFCLRDRAMSACDMAWCAGIIWVACWKFGVSHFPVYYCFVAKLTNDVLTVHMFRNAKLCEKYMAPLLKEEKCTDMVQELGFGLQGHGDVWYISGE